MTDRRNYPECQIFDPECIERNLSGRPSRIVSQYHDLNESDRPGAKQVRIFLEELLQLVPCKHRKPILSRLQTTNDCAFESQTFELLILKLFLRAGWKLKKIETPNLPQGRPDFMFENSDHQKLYVEATVVFGLSDEEKNIERLRRDILHKLDSIESSEFWLDLGIFGNPTKQPKAQPIIRKIEAWLSGFSKSDSYRNVKPLKLNIEGMSITIRIMQERYHQRTDGPTFGMERRWNTSPDYDKHLRNKLKTKFNKYKDLDAPLIIAVNNTQVPKHYEALKHTLYGSKQSIEHIENSKTDDSSGLWTHHDLVKNTRVSGVLYFHRLKAWNAGRSTVVLEKHPLPKYKLPKLNLPVGNLEKKGSEFVCDQETPLYEALGLTKSWPEL